MTPVLPLHLRRTFSGKKNLMMLVVVPRIEQGLMRLPASHSDALQAVKAMVLESHLRFLDCQNSHLAVIRSFLTDPRQTAISFPPILRVSGKE